jgi:deoxyribose-phosphate aldolase
MNQQEILHRVDHTLLTTTATWEQVKKVCDEGRQFSTASVCIPPRYVKRAGDYVGNDLKICTVIGFPNGYNTPEVKVFETEDAIRCGADEIDMVMNLGLFKNKDWEGVLTEIKEIKASCKGRILKVIVEACQLTQEEKVIACQLVSMSGADFIKTSTGFSTGGATVEDVKLFRDNLSPDVRIKAAGGIRTFEQAAALLEAGADRIGASALVALAQEQGSSL